MANSKPNLNIELTTSGICDMKCTYCFEGEKTDKKRFSNFDLLFKRIEEVKKSDFYKDFGGISINFWGGEPTLNWKYIRVVTEKYADDPEVQFHLYSNGYNFKNMARTLEGFKDIKHKVFIQISFDGKTNDIFRVASNGGTSENVMKTFQYLADEGYNIHMKATMPIQTVSNIFENWNHYRELFYKYKNYENVFISYAPTIDYTQNAYNVGELEPKLDKFREQMMLVAKGEIQFMREHDRFLMSWFNTDIKEEKTNCSAGVNFISVDTEGDSYACHGAFYSSIKDELKQSSLEDDNFVENVTKFNSNIKTVLNHTPDSCRGCESTYCAVCPVVLAENSKKETLTERWSDRPAHGLCPFYKAFGLIHRAMIKHLSNTL